MTRHDPVEPLYPANAAPPYELHTAAALDYVRWSQRIAAGGHLGLPWGPVDRIVGPLLPGWLVLVGARGKGGKSTFLREVFHAWVTDFGKRVLYVGTEQSAGILRALWACLRLRLPTEAALDPLHPAHSRVMDDVTKGQVQDDLHNRAIVVAEPDITVEILIQWARVAYRERCDVLMFDHFHRLASGGSDPWGQRNAAIRQIKNAAAKSNLLIVCAAQLKNGEGGALGEYEVPGSQSWAETAGLRRECDVAIQLWRPFRLGATREQKAAARDDAAQLAELVDRNVMAVRCDAHRYRDAAPYQAARLYVHDGQITSWSGRVP
jgi:hypothetical protein